jgi:beta-glucanase (GH16 family)
VTQIQTPFNPHTTMVDYAIEWEPDVVRWFINGEVTTVFTHQHIDQLVHPMRIFMNLWAVENVGWTGEWDPTAMPGMSRYDHVKYYAYTPGTGNAGTSNNYTLEWVDDFDTLDATRWDQSEDGSVGPLCTFRSANVEVVNGELQLTIT